MPSRSIWRSHDFRTLFCASAVSHIGSNSAYAVLPLVAVAALAAGPVQVGALGALSTAAFLVIGLPAGAWVDRMRHHRVLVMADVIRAALALSIPVAWWVDRLTLEQMFAVVVLNGVATVFFDVAAQSMLPQTVDEDGLVQATSGMASLYAVGNVAGKGAGGGMAQALTAPIAAIFVSVSYSLSAVVLTRLNGSRPPISVHTQPPMRAQISEGLRHVLRDREMRALAASGAMTNLGSQIVNTMMPILFVRDLGLPAGTLGLFWAIGGLGLLLGAWVARPLAERLGHGRALGLLGVCLAPAGLLVPLIDRGPWLCVAGAGWLVMMMKTGVDNVLGVSLRQRKTPTVLLGRMNATFRFLLTGALTVGAAVAGLCGEMVGVRATMWLGGVTLCFAFFPVFASPVRRRRQLPVACHADVLGDVESDKVDRD